MSVIISESPFVVLFTSRLKSLNKFLIFRANGLQTRPDKLNDFMICIPASGHIAANNSPRLPSRFDASNKFSVDT